MRLLLAGLLALGVARADADPRSLVVDLGARRKALQSSLQAAGVTNITQSAFDEPGAYARGLLNPPGLLALLNRVDAAHPFFDGLPEAGPTFITARVGNARAAYGFAKGRMAAFAVSLPYSVVKPRPEPFDMGRLQPLRDTINQLCPRARVIEKDDYGNAITWAGTCRGGSATVWYEPEDRDAALKMLVVR